MEKVLVTGASGFIAEHCIIELLKNGYSVKGSLRSMNREQEVRDAVKTETDDAKLEFCKLFYSYQLRYRKLISNYFFYQSQSVF